MREITTLQAAERTHAAGLLDQAPAAARGWSPRRRAVFGGLASLGTAAAAIAVVTAISLTSGPAATGPTAFAIQRVSNNTVSVHIVNTTAAADQMTAQLHEQGLNVTIDAVPASSQLVGTWLTASFSEDVPESTIQQILTQVPNGYTTTVDLPATFAGEIRLGVGRLPAAGEELQVSGMRNALAPGARLGCLHATGDDPAHVQQAVEQLGYTITWADGDARDLAIVPGASAGQKVVAAFIDDTHPAQVQLVAATPGSGRYDARSRMGYAPTQWQTRANNPGACTPA